MIKKIFVGVVIAAVFGLLVLGAVNRTLAKAVDNSPLALNQAGEGGPGGGKHGDGADESGNQDRGGHGDPGDCSTDRAGNGSPAGIASEESPQDGSGYQGGSGNNGTPGQGGPSANVPCDGIGEGQANVDAWKTLTGTVQSVESDLWQITLEDGSLVEIEGRALSFAQEQGFSLAVGHDLSLTGFFENGAFEAGKIENLTSGESIMLRDETGRPLWAGGRRGGNN
jgi:hypothetical protein